MKMARTAADAAVEPSPWGPHEWLCRPGLTDAKDLQLVRVSMPPGTGHAFHRHPTMEEIIYVVAGRAEAPAAAAVKGRPVLADVVAAAVRDRQAPPGDAFDVRVGDEVVRLEPEFWTAAADRARATRRPQTWPRR